MNLVRQPEDTYLCQACCAAMLTDKTLEYVLDNVKLHGAPDGSGKLYLTNKEFFRYMIDHDCFPGAIGSWDPSIALDSTKVDFERVDKLPALVGVESKIYVGGCHAVVWDAESRRIYDPQEPVPMHACDYMIYEWIPITRMI